LHYTKLQTNDEAFAQLANRVRMPRLAEERLKVVGN